MKIVALDLGKFNSVACIYQTDDGKHEFRTIKSNAAAIHDLLAQTDARRLVIEVGATAGWVKDLGQAMGLEVQVANVNAESWQWKRRKRKTDRDDALKLARISALGELPQVYLPAKHVREGKISCQGNRLLRALLVEVSWLMKRWNGQFWEIFQNVSRGIKKRRKTAIVAVARRLLVTCWAMLRDNKPWRPATKEKLQAA